MYTLCHGLSQNQDSPNLQNRDGFDFQIPTPITPHVRAQINTHKWVFLPQKADTAADSYNVYKWSVMTLHWFQLPRLKNAKASAWFRPMCFAEVFEGMK